MYEGYVDTVTSDRQLAPIDFADLWKRYCINIRTGCIYDNVSGNYVLPYNGEDDSLYVKLNSEKEGEIVAELTTLMLWMIYGITNSGNIDKVTEFPINSIYLAPDIITYEKKDPTHLIINGIDYYRWKDTPYFASKDGTLFSIRLGQWLRKNYNEKLYAVVSTKERGTGIKKDFKVHRIVWEAFHGAIPKDCEIDHIDNRRYHNSIDNLQLLSHIDNLYKKNPDRHYSLSDDELRSIAADFLSYMSTKDISIKYNLHHQYVEKIKNGKLFADRFKDLGIDISGKLYRDRAINPDIIREIRAARKNGMTPSGISQKYNVGINSVYQILQGRTYKDIV